MGRQASKSKIRNLKRYDFAILIMLYSYLENTFKSLWISYSLKLAFHRVGGSSTAVKNTRTISIAMIVSKKHSNLKKW